MIMVGEGEFESPPHGKDEVGHGISLTPPAGPCSFVGSEGVLFFMYAWELVAFDMMRNVG